MLRHNISTGKPPAAIIPPVPGPSRTGGKPPPGHAGSGAPDGRSSVRTAWWTSDAQALASAKVGIINPGGAIGQAHPLPDVGSARLLIAASASAEASPVVEAPGPSRACFGFATIARYPLHLWMMVQREYRISRAIGQLERLDDRMLRDIGIMRYEIRRYARFGSDRVRDGE